MVIKDTIHTDQLLILLELLLSSSGTRGAQPEGDPHPDRPIPGPILLFQQFIPCPVTYYNRSYEKTSTPSIPNVQLFIFIYLAWKPIIKTKYLPVLFLKR